MENNNLTEWQEYFVKKDIDKNLYQKYLAYIEKLYLNSVPIIFELEHFAMLLGIDYKVLLKILNSPSFFYREFTIPKRNGSKRIISMPYPVLLFVQRWINKEILEKVMKDESTHGFVKNRSIISNASMHVYSKVILKIDIKDFFPSISIDRVIRIFRNLGYSKKVSYFLAAFCFHKNQLPQGAATSPTISNIIAKRLDKRLKGLSNKWEIFYTRYADDLTFSGKYIPIKFLDIVEKVINTERFVINKEKTRLISGNGKRIITGISISSNKLKIPKATKRKLRLEGFLVTKHPSLLKSGIDKDPFFIERIIGKYNFWLMVEPNNQFARRIFYKLTQLQKEII